MKRCGESRGKRLRLRQTGHLTKENIMASADEGFGQGCGCVFGVLFAVALILVMLYAGGKVVSPCSACHASGNCATCGGNGKGVLWGECGNCGGKKSCPSCGGSGWKSK